jgi:hypothetical protein
MDGRTADSHAGILRHRLRFGSLPVYAAGGRSPGVLNARRKYLRCFDACLDPELSSEITSKPVSPRRRHAPAFSSVTRRPSARRRTDVGYRPAGPVLGGARWIRSAVMLSPFAPRSAQAPTLPHRRGQRAAAELGSAIPTGSDSLAHPFTPSAAYLAEGGPLQGTNICARAPSCIRTRRPGCPGLVGAAMSPGPLLPHRWFLPGASRPAIRPCGVASRGGLREQLPRHSPARRSPTKPTSPYPWYPGWYR